MYQQVDTENVPIKAWAQGVEISDKAWQQLRNVASMPFVYRWVAAMPDAHFGLGATVGSVIPTRKAIIPAAVGVDLGCGMMAVETSLKATDLPDDLKEIRNRIEKAIPHGRTNHGGRNDRGAWGRQMPARVEKAWKKLERGFKPIHGKHPKLDNGRQASQLGTLGTGNHFVEVCLDEVDQVWVMLHSGSRGIGNKIGSYFIAKAKKDMGDRLGNLPDRDLAYYAEGSRGFDDYVEAVHWAQAYARVNRELMMEAALEAVGRCKGIPRFKTESQAVNCHHNYVQQEEHYGEAVFVTRKGAVSAREGEFGIIPGSMGAKSFIVRGKGNPESFCSCSHGAGRAMSRTQARKQFTVDDHVAATKGIECRKDHEVIDETPMAYKPIEDVMQAQNDLVEVVHTLRQVVCVKG